ncbi:DUF4837 family protein [Carboxylicivirga mesophila]|uniref:DUF4837 family protein n=1 Tax=Carboxylicivirga mesophila TaxID=1166478 RepID=A0ABS5K5W5_9BACT|nr:DUF4837 family protein [Carboxylicivirga mesophila]MBS2210389.1 DUF4837 family protein [Carboxylicivirga mesophila]
MRHFKYLLIAIVVLMVGCKDKQTGYKPNVGGKAGEMLVVMDDKIKTSPGGEELQALLTETYLGLPQEEPHFKMSVAPHRSFANFLRTIRNIVMVTVKPDVKEEAVKFYHDRWARPQAVVSITAKDTASLKQLVEANQLKILSFFNKAERERFIGEYKKFASDELMKLTDSTFHVHMSIPNSLSNKKSTKSFIWMNEAADWGFQGMFLYEVPYVGEGTFSKEYLLNKRDSILHKNVPGPSEGSFMTTEHLYPVIYKKTEINGNEVVEMRGLWKVQNDMMGGPFVLQAHYDKKSNRVVITDGFVYSPEKPDKRDKIRQMEALMYTLTFK